MRTYFRRDTAHPPIVGVALEGLREAFRRFVFFRFGIYPEADSFKDVAWNLRILGKKLKNLSSVQKYFTYGIGERPLIDIEPKFEEYSKLIEMGSKEIGNLS